MLANRHVPSFYLAGQSNFGNRGCEALVRSSASSLAKYFSKIEVIIPSEDAEADAKQWNGGDGLSVRFSRPMRPSRILVWWNRLVSRLPASLFFPPPGDGVPQWVVNDIRRCDAILMIGGDNISLDYGVGSLFMWTQLMDKAAQLGKKTILFAASVGPFSTNKRVERALCAHLKRYSLITVRERASFEYLRQLGIENVHLVADPAFSLEAETAAVPGLFANAEIGVLGVNISPIISRGGNEQRVRVAVAEFVERVLGETTLSVALIPHVDPLVGVGNNSDSALLREVYSLVGEKERVVLVPPGLNAAQVKFLISKCRYFVGARTHATIAAWSSGVPTISIAYSVKARGLNQDLFGNQDYVVEDCDLSANALFERFQRLVSDESLIRRQLDNQIPVRRTNAERTAALVREMLR